MSNFEYYTAEGLTNLKNEIHRLETIERKSISQQIADARDKGDLSENAEYDAAKEKQGLMEAKLADLKGKLVHARLIDESQIDTSKVLILSIVTIKNLKNNKEMVYTLVAENEANLKLGKISIDSPISKGLLGLSVGDIADIKIPAGVMQLEILKIERS